jgi:hypothetical protein
VTNENEQIQYAVVKQGKSGKHVVSKDFPESQTQIIEEEKKCDETPFAKRKGKNENFSI